MKRLLTAAVMITLSACACAASASGANAISPAKRADIVKLIHTTGAMNIGLHMGTALADQLIANLRRTHPDISDLAIRDIQQACSALINRPATQAKLLDDTVKIYAKYYSDADIKGMIRFYSTPLGKKIVKTIPEIAQQSMAAGEDAFKPLQGELIDLIRQYLQRDHINPRTLKAEKSG